MALKVRGSSLSRYLAAQSLLLNSQVLFQHFHFLLFLICNLRNRRSLLPPDVDEVIKFFSYQIDFRFTSFSVTNDFSLLAFVVH